MVERQWHEVSGGSPMQFWRIPVIRYRGIGGGPGAYLQAALHADEQPGVAVIHALAPLIARAEAEGRLRGDVTLVPYANPIGLHQSVDGRQMGRFHLGTGTNFNRAYALEAEPLPLPPSATPDRFLKAALVGLAKGADIVLDLHCDKEASLYMYTHAALWPSAQDLAARLGVVGVILWADDEEGGRAFEQAVTDHRLADLATRPFLSATVEFRGEADVDRELAARDAAALYALLVDRGTVRDEGVPPAPPWSGPAHGHDCIVNVQAPALGTLLPEAPVGIRVAAGDRLATILAAPGDPAGEVAVTAPADGLLIIRAASRLARPGDTIATILADAPNPESAAGRTLSNR